MENYEKKYKEVLEKAKALYKASEPMSGCNVIIETLFPELAESEDEKIRKEIINYFKCQTRDEPSRKDTHNKWISWLERQEGCEVIKKDWLEYIKQSWYKEGFIDGKYAEKRCLEWTQNDATILNELIDFLENKTVKLQHDLTRYANWLKNQFTPIEKQGEKKASYTTIVETGNGGINALVTLPTEMKSAEESLGIDSDTYNKIVDECIFGEQKHVWSEEDEELLKWSINNLTELKDRFGEEYGKVGKCIDWLKSLRPLKRWKPSEEQIKVCKEVYADILSAKGFNLGTVNSELNRLEEELKKLKK